MLLDGLSGVALSDVSGIERKEPSESAHELDYVGMDPGREVFGCGLLVSIVLDRKEVFPNALPDLAPSRPLSHQ